MVIIEVEEDQLILQYQKEIVVYFPSSLIPVRWLSDLTGQGRQRWVSLQQLMLRKRPKFSVPLACLC